MAIVAINQQLGSRGDELGKIVADALGYRFWGRREMVTAAARAYRVGPEQFLILDEHQPHFWERPKVDADRLRAFLRATLFKEIAQDRMVFASSSGTQLLPANGFALRVRAMAAFPVRLRNIVQIEKLTTSAAEKRVRDHDREVKARALSLYNFEIDDPNAYDLVLNTSVLPLDTTAATLRACIEQIEASLDGRGLQEIRDAALAAQVRAALLSHPKFGLADIKVECDRGAVRMNGPGLVAPWDNLARQVAAGIDGVTSCDIGSDEPPMPLRPE
ncbi:MAG TPA: cytidylate kinase-like family protein [Candidatus Binataceae bacterium]|nr:cytidylate kinase-like family protein [Candidatus Binataceae bacterium]